MKHLTIAALLCFGTVFTAQAQDELTFGSYDITLESHGNAPGGESFHFDGGLLKSVSAPVYTRLNRASQPGRIRIYQGSGFGGTLVYEHEIIVPSIAARFPGVDFTGLGDSDFESYWTSMFDLISAGTWIYDDIASTYEINQNFESGDYTFQFELDTAFSEGSETWMTMFQSSWVDTYTEGQMFWGAGWDANSDHAFEITYAPTVTTGVEEYASDLKPFRIVDGVFIANERLSFLAWNVTGQTLNLAQLPRQQVAIIALGDKVWKEFVN